MLIRDIEEVRHFEDDRASKEMYVTPQLQLQLQLQHRVSVLYYAARNQ